MKLQKVFLQMEYTFLHIKNLKIKIVINMISVISIIDKSRELFYSIYGFR